MTQPSGPEVRITLNGQEKAVPAGLSVASLLDHLELKQDRVAVELNREIVPKSRWQDAEVEDGAQVEIVHFVGGGSRG